MSREAPLAGLNALKSHCLALLDFKVRDARGDEHAVLTESAPAADLQRVDTRRDRIRHGRVDRTSRRVDDIELVLASGVDDEEPLVGVRQAGGAP